MRHGGERFALDYGKRLAHEAVGKAADVVRESFRRHVRMAKALAGYLPFSDRIMGRGGEKRTGPDGL